LDLTAKFVKAENERFSVETTTNPEKGLEMVADRTFDCIISDYDMPNTNGIEFLGRIRENNPRIPFILFTSKGIDTVGSDAISAGITDYLQKGHKSSKYTLLTNRILNAVKRYESDKRRERWRQAIDAAADGVGIVSADGRYVQLNEAYASVFDTSKTDLAGTDWSEWYPDDQVRQFREEIFPELREKETWHGRVVGRRTDGTQFGQLLSLSLLKDGGHVFIIEEYEM
jgi:PAS domain S-box-containing protein